MQRLRLQTMKTSLTDGWCKRIYTDVLVNLRCLPHRCPRYTRNKLAHRYKCGCTCTMWRVNHETIIDTLSWCKILPHTGFNLIRAYRKLLRRRKKSSRILRAVVRTNHWSFENLVQKYHGFTKRPQLIDPRQTALLREIRTKGKEGTSAVLTMTMTMTHSVADYLEIFVYLRNVQDLFGRRETSQ